MEPAMMTWHVTKHPESDFCLMGYHITDMEDTLQPHDEEVCEELVMCMAQEPLSHGDDIAANMQQMFNRNLGMGPEGKTMFFTKKLWVPNNFDPLGMYEDLSFNYSASTESARWLHDPDPQMSMFVSDHGCIPAEQPVLKRNTRMFVVNNHNYLATCLDEELGVEFEYHDYESLPHDEVLGSQFWQREMPDMTTDEKVLLRV